MRNSLLVAFGILKKVLEILIELAQIGLLIFVFIDIYKGDNIAAILDCAMVTVFTVSKIENKLDLLYVEDPMYVLEDNEVSVGG